MTKYRKKPVVIEAVQLNRGTHSVSDVLSFMGQFSGLRTSMDHERFEDYCYIVYDKGMEIKTLEGVITADIGDYIIKGVKGEFYPCKPDIFALTYDNVDDVIPYVVTGNSSGKRVYADINAEGHPIANFVNKQVEELSNERRAVLASPYGKYVNEYAKNHGITMEEAYEKPMCKAALDHYIERGRLGGW